MAEPIRIGVLASGRGSNLQAIIDAARAGELNARVEIVLSDNAGALALGRAREHGIEARAFDIKKFKDRTAYEKDIVKALRSKKVDLVCLAGYMRIVGPELLGQFKGRIVNIHPALLPSFPGLHAQRQALDHGVKVSGCTVHFVDEGTDTGPIIVQVAVPVLEHDDEASLSERILEQEHKAYVEAIRLYSEGRLKMEGRRVKVNSRHETR